MSALLLLRLGRQLPRVMASTPSLQLPRVKASTPSLYARQEISTGLPRLAGAGHSGLTTGLNMEQDYGKLVSKLGETIERHRLDNTFFHTSLVVLFGALIAAMGSLTMKINKTDMENSSLSAELAREKAKREALAEEVKFWTSLVSAIDGSPDLDHVEKTEKTEASTPTTSTPPATCSPGAGPASA